MIADLLPRYREVDRGVEWTVIRSIVIDGHEVALMRFDGTRPDGSTYTGTDLKCECDFTEGVGWQLDEKYGRVGIHRNECRYMGAAKFLRKRELSEEYLERYSGTMADGTPLHHSGLDSALFGRPELYGEILLDLIERARAGEWLGESGAGANFWGGHFYIQTFADIVELPPSVAWPTADKLVAEKRISLEGAVVQDYREPPAPEERGSVWESTLDDRYECRVERIDGSTGELVMTDGDRELLRERVGLAYGAAFGPDADDVARWSERCKEVVDG